MNTYDCGDTYGSNFPCETDGGKTEDEWNAIANQLDYYADLDKEYWRQRRENEYRLFLERKYGVIAQ